MLFLLEYSENDGKFLFNPLDADKNSWSVEVMSYGRRPITIVDDTALEPELLEYILDRSNKGYSYERVASEILNYFAYINGRDER